MKKRLKKYLSIILPIVLIITLTSSFATPTLATDEKAYLSKIDAPLLEHMDSVGDDELIPINIWLKALDKAALLEKVKAETGMDPDIYMNEDRFEKEVASKIRTVLEKKLGYEEAHKVVSTDSTGDELLSETAEPLSETTALLSETTCAAIQSAFSGELKDLIIDPSSIIEFVQTDRSASIIDYTILEARQQFQEEKNRVIKKEYCAYNDDFIFSCVEKRQNKVTSVSHYTPTLFIKAKKADILYYAQQPEVVDIYYDDPNMVATPTLQKVVEQVKADSTTGTQSANFNNGAGFKGTGIKIGILEAEGAIDTSSPHYNSKRMHIISNGNIYPTADVHASLVTAIIAGERVEYNGNVYQGIVPKAEVYITKANRASNLVDGLNALAECGVRVINISLGFYNTSTYSYIDRYLDTFIYDTDITCVVAAGNNADGKGDKTTYISSPGYALNCITVGNLNTKSNGVAIRPSPYTINASSSWQEPDSLPNKPDICAPGTWVRAVKATTGTNNFYYESEGLEPSGTSFAAPIVTGIVAQMMQEHSAKLSNPMAVKAKIMAAAKVPVVSSTNNITQGNTYLREKSGAGMVDAVRALKGSSYYKYAWNHYNIEASYVTQATINLSANQTLRAGLAFNNGNLDFNISSINDYCNMDLRIVDASTGAVLVSATQDRNNVEIVEYTSATTRTVYVQTRIVRHVTDVKIDWALEVVRY